MRLARGSVEGKGGRQVACVDYEALLCDIDSNRLRAGVAKVLVLKRVAPLSLSIFALTLSGCGSGGGTSNPAPPVTLPTPAPTPTPTPTPPPTGLPSVEREILPVATSAQISSNFSAHYAVNPSPTVTQRGRLFVMLPGTGAIPRFYRQILRVGAARGYHAIGLTYPNDTAVGTLCAGAAADCSDRVRREIVTGSENSPLVTVNAANSINGRLSAMIAHMHQRFPDEGWGQFLVGGSPDWSRITVAGHSQGSGHAAYMGKLVLLDRVVMFSGPSDVAGATMAPWLSASGLTLSTRYFGFTHTADSLTPLALVSAAWSALGMSGSGPIYNIDGQIAPYGNARQLVTSAPPNPTSMEVDREHSSTIIDAITPVGPDGRFVYQPVWEYLAFPQ